MMSLNAAYNYLSDIMHQITRDAEDDPKERYNVSQKIEALRIAQSLIRTQLSIEGADYGPTSLNETDSLFRHER